MAYVITTPCIDTTDQSCVDVCPVDCIHFEEGKDRMLYIDPDECIDCGACEPACPVSAIAFRPIPDGRFLPLVDETACTGCGACVAPCPVEAVAVIEPPTRGERA